MSLFSRCIFITKNHSAYKASLWNPHKNICYNKLFLDNAIFSNKVNQDTSTYRDLEQEEDQEDINEHGDGSHEQSCPLASLDANLVIYYLSLYPLILQE